VLKPVLGLCLFWFLNRAAVAIDLQSLSSSAKAEAPRQMS